MTHDLIELSLIIQITLSVISRLGSAEVQNENASYVYFLASFLNHFFSFVFQYFVMIRLGQVETSIY